MNFPLSFPAFYRDCSTSDKCRLFASEQFVLCGIVYIAEVILTERLDQCLHFGLEHSILSKELKQSKILEKKENIDPKNSMFFKKEKL